MANSMMTIEEMKKMSPSEIDKEIAKNKMELLKAKLHTVSQHSKETHLLKQLRKHVARLQTAKKELKSN